MSVRVLLADDHTLVRSGLRELADKLPGVEAVAEASDGQEALELTARLAPDVVLVDIHMPRLNGLETIVRLKRDHPRVRSVVLSMYANEEYVLRALRSGASGYLLKDAQPEELGRAIRTVMLGETYLDTRVAAFIADYVRKVEDAGDPLRRLTSRQREVLQLVAQGYSTKGIAKALGVSVKTAEAHRGQIMKTLGIHDVAGLVRFAIREGLITP